MSKPKKKVVKEKYSVYLKNLDLFEQRWEPNNGYFYLFNPFTGETICQTGDFYDRQLSSWVRPETTSKLVDLIEMFPLLYLSRSWGRRKFISWESIDDAATQIAAMIRGWLARNALRRYYATRYCKIFDKTSGYFYFTDNWDPNTPTFWHKPRLAFPDDIPEYDPTPPDPQDFLKGDKYTYKPFTKGPYIKLVGTGKLQKARAEHGTANYLKSIFPV